MRAREAGSVHRRRPNGITRLLSSLIIVVRLSGLCVSRPRPPSQGRLHAMCAQCVMGAATAAPGATGIRAWLATRGFAWLTPRRMRLATISLIPVGLLGASVGVGAP